jgi:hypothetical protein
VEISLPTAEVGGVLLAPDGTSAPARTVQILEPGSELLVSTGRQTVTASDGSFRFRGVADGTYRLETFVCDAAWRPWPFPEPVVVKNGHSVTGLELQEPDATRVECSDNSGDQAEEER